MAQWVTLRPIFEVCGREETGYEGGGIRQDPWWWETVADAQLRDTLVDILADAQK